jgi:hypothetical protein
MVKPTDKREKYTMSDSDFVFSGNLTSSHTLNSGSSFLQPLREWLDNLEVSDRRLARFLYKLIPGQCPFERDIIVLGRKLAHIPPLCKLNPLYEQLVGLRFRSMCYLVDVCGEAI